jgi:superfamily II DNA/RNA helicase
MSTVAHLHDSHQIYSLLQELDTSRLAQELGAERANVSEPILKLRVAAYLSLSNLIGESSVDSTLRKLASEEEIVSAEVEAATTFQKWSGYIKTLIEADQVLLINDLLFFSTAGFLANQPIEVRSVLRHETCRRVVDSSLDNADAREWTQRVKDNISAAILLLIRQEHHEDVKKAGDIIQELAKDQRKIEAEWLHKKANPQRDAISLLGLYHLAQVIIRTSEFLLAGSVEDEGQLITDFAPELRRLLVRSEEYLLLSSDIDTLFWLNSIAIILWRIRTDSIWVLGSGISERLDELLHALSMIGREKPIFSLLPSQQDALRQNLLDPTKIAVVLQMPTSAGKTLLAEFSIVQTFEAYKENTRVAYIVPTRALATQVQRTLAEDLRPLGIQVSAAGSAFEEDPYELQLLQENDGVVVATPEKLDLLFRAHPRWFEKLRQIIVDEAHLLQESERGVRLELLLANIRRERPQARLLLLTPFIPNAKEISSWLGGGRGLAISVRWRPSRLLLGIAAISGSGSKRGLTIEWKEPYSPRVAPKPIRIPVDVPSNQISTTTAKIVYLADRFSHLGTILALFSASPKDAEKAAHAIALQRKRLNLNSQSAALRVAIAIAKNEYGSDSVLSYCLERGVAYHHSSLSSILRYLIEDQVRDGTIQFIAATTTLAQGMNFPVAVVLIHSVHKPYGQGPLTSSEFWNIAGRAGRVGLVDKGLVIFADKKHRHHFDRYTEDLQQAVRSALLGVLKLIGGEESLKEQYREHEELRPFIQFLAHAAATESPKRAMARLDELIQSSLANAQVESQLEAEMLRRIARQYLELISDRQPQYLKVADTTGLGSFSFDELFSRIGDDPVLQAGPGAILSLKEEGVYHLVDILRWLPELSLAIGLGVGQMSVETVAKVVQGWMDGMTIPELADNFPGETIQDKIRNTARYVFGEVSQTISWGAHAYMRGWSARKSGETQSIPPADAMLGAYIQYGVKTPEAALASLLGVPRQLAESFASVYRENNGALVPENAAHFKDFVEGADTSVWKAVSSRSNLANDVDPDDLRKVWHQMHGSN